MFCGLPADAQFATWLLDTLTNFVQAELVNFLMDAAPSNEDRREAIRSFVAGCTDRISDQLSKLCEQSATLATSNAKALVVIKDAAIKAKLNELGKSTFAPNLAAAEPATLRVTKRATLPVVARVLGVQCQAATQRCG